MAKKDKTNDFEINVANRSWVAIEYQKTLEGQTQQDVEAIESLAGDLTDQLILYFNAFKGNPDKVDLKKQLSETLFSVSQYFSEKAINNDNLLKKLAKK